MIPLEPVPNKEWQQEFDELMRDPYLMIKYDRERRLKDKERYIHRYVSEFRRGWSILDLGPGPGEFMEILRDKGCMVYGIDARPDDCEMGNGYLKLSRLMIQRQNFESCVDYSGVDYWIFNNGRYPFPDDSLNLVNSQGSIEQIFKKYMDGVPHLVHKNAKQLLWRMDCETKDAMDLFFRVTSKVLCENGVFLIAANGASNEDEYDSLVCEMATKNGFKIVIREPSCLHKMVRI
ncbi:MAG: methyltransferase domain-containing protein [Methanomassiliicoccales archaeon]|jgi:SAM-dependent methyltransferase